MKSNVLPERKLLVPLCVLLLTGVFAIACSEHRYRVYDSYHSDYHRWDNHEAVYYERWSAETHRDSHRDFEKLPPDEQREYWNWRHEHP